MPSGSRKVHLRRSSGLWIVFVRSSKPGYVWECPKFLHYCEARSFIWNLID